jgi:hypothetical protein
MFATTSVASKMPPEAIINSVSADTDQIPDDHIPDRAATTVEIKTATFELSKHIKDKPNEPAGVDFKINGKSYYAEIFPFQRQFGGPPSLHIVEYNQHGGPVSESWTLLPKVAD